VYLAADRREADVDTITSLVKAREAFSTQEKCERHLLNMR